MSESGTITKKCQQVRSWTITPGEKFMMQFYSTITSFYPTLLTAIKQPDICASLCIVCVVMITLFFIISNSSLALSRYRCMQTCIVTVVVSKVWVDIWFQGRYDFRKRAVDVQIQSKHRNRFVSFPYMSQVHRKYISSNRKDGSEEILHPSQNTS